MVYERAKELADVLYPPINSQTSEQHKQVIRKCLEGHDMSKLPSNSFLQLIVDGVILPDQL